MLVEGTAQLPKMYGSKPELLTTAPLSLPAIEGSNIIERLEDGKKIDKAWGKI
jgi:hypothetical protein